MKKSYLVSGGAGFIGSHICDYLINNGAKKVTVIDNLSTGYMKNINHLLKNKNFHFVKGDITDYQLCLKLTKDVDAVCHQAALGSVPKSIDNPINTNTNNISGFLNLLDACRVNGVKRFVYASSSSVYGDSKGLPTVEEKIGKQLSPYAVTKYTNELYAHVFYKLYGIETIGLRYFNIFGPRQDPNGAYAAVIPKFISILKNDKKPTINGDGKFSRDFTFVDNAVQANYLAMNTKNKKAFGNIFNIGCGKKTTILELYQSIAKYMKKDSTPIFGPERLGDVPHSVANISKAKKNLNYIPKVNFDNGLKLTVDYFTNLK